jgi:glutamate carboxypeptidase
MNPSGELNALLAWARARTDEMVALLRDLVAIESPSSDPAGVAALADRLAHELVATGLAVDALPVAGAGPVLRGRSASRGRPVLLLGHLDTVWPLGTLARRPVRVQGGRLHGPGAYDMKGGLVVALYALRALAARGPLPAIGVFFTPLEEVGGAAYRREMEKAMRASTAVLDFEPAWPGGAVKTSRKGSGTFRLVAHGRAAHAGADFARGANAVLEAARLIATVSGWTDLPRGVTVNVGVVRGGLRPNVIPDRAEAEVDVRYRRAADGRRLEARFRRLRPTTRGVRIGVEGGLHYPPLERGPHVRAVYRQAKAVAAELGMRLREVTTGGASEAAFAAALGVPTLDGLGVDGDGAHAEHEHVRIASLPERAALAAGLIRRLIEPTMSAGRRAPGRPS